MQNKFAWSSAICVPSGCLNSLLTRGLFAKLTDGEGRGGGGGGGIKISGRGGVGGGGREGARD